MRRKLVMYEIGFRMLTCSRHNILTQEVRVDLSVTGTEAFTLLISASLFAAVLFLRRCARMYRTDSVTWTPLCFFRIRKTRNPRKNTNKSYRLPRSLRRITNRMKTALFCQQMLLQLDFLVGCALASQAWHAKQVKRVTQTKKANKNIWIFSRTQTSNVGYSSADSADKCKHAIAADLCALMYITFRTWSYFTNTWSIRSDSLTFLLILKRFTKQLQDHSLNPR